MNNLYILTEERAKNNIIKLISRIYGKISNKDVNFDEIKIFPEIKNNHHTFTYFVDGIVIEGIDNVLLKIVSGNSSFVDYILYEGNEEPGEDTSNNPILLIEETKTSDEESRNTGVYQRISKFIYADYFYPNITKIMLYNLNRRNSGKPTDTNIFGTNMLLTQGVKIIGKKMHYFNCFKNIDDFIKFKNKMKRPPRGNVPIEIKYKDKNTITISGRLSKPKDKGNIGHDPNIGALTSIAKTLRLLGWEKDIIITKHGVKQSYINNLSRSNKFLNIASKLDIKLDELTFDVNDMIPTNYWRYEKKSEKIGTIFLTISAVNLNNNIKAIYENHAGCERGYFYLKNGNPITIPKKNKNININIPDSVLLNKKYNEILIIEGKRSSTLDQGLDELNNFDLFEDLFVKKEYPNYHVSRWVSTYGEDIYQGNLNSEVLFHLNDDGSFYFNNNAPNWIKNIFENI